MNEENLKEHYTTTEYNIKGERFYFVECDICRNKCGSPELCQSCLINRDSISKLMKLAKNQ